MYRIEELIVPFIFHLVVWGLAWGVGLSGVVPQLSAPVEGIRVGFAAMFVLTGVAHFAPRTRAEMIRMVPPSLPAAGHLVSITGVLELAGAAGLLLPAWSRWAAAGLALLLIGMFPANVHAARTGLQVAGRRAMSIGPRLGLQLFWIVGLMWLAVAAGGASAT